MEGGNWTNRIVVLNTVVFRPPDRAPSRSAVMMGSGGCFKTKSDHDAVFSHAGVFVCIISMRLTLAWTEYLGGVLHGPTYLRGYQLYQS
jgi:hypothetical protein